MTELQKYSTNDLIEISKNNVFAIQAMQDGMKAINREVTKLKISKDEHEERLNYLENTSEITNSQAKQLQEEVKSKARACTGYPSSLYRLVMADIWNFLKRNYHVAASYKETQKIHFEDALTGIKFYIYDEEKIKERREAIDKEKELSAQ